MSFSYSANVIDEWSFEFQEIKVPAVSAAGVAYLRRRRIGMPTIPPHVLDSVFYLYASRADAEAGTNLGGTGFLLAVPLQVGQYIYAVTNWHVAVSGGHSVIRLNTKDGETDIIELDPIDWIFKPNWHDLAIADVALDHDKHKTSLVPTNLISPLEVLEGGGVGPGSDVFMIGRFVDYDGGITNQPTARFGHISAMPIVIDRRVGGDGMPSYLLDMHSRSGYSGSPVFVYQPEIVVNQGALSMYGGPGFLRLLAVHSGQFSEPLEIHSTEHKPRGNCPTDISDPTKKFVQGWSGMTFAVPAHAIMELLDVPKLKEPRDQVIEELRIKHANGPVLESAASESTEPHAKGENPQHREDFSRLLDAAARGSKPSPGKA